MKNKKQPVNGMLCKPLTLEEAKTLKVGQTVYFRKENDSRGQLRKVKVTGQVKTWKRDTERVQIPWKYGLRDYGYITELYLEDWTLESKPYERFENIRVCPATGLEEMLYNYTKNFIESDKQLRNDGDLWSIILFIERLLNNYDNLSTEDCNQYLGYTLYERLCDKMGEFAPSGYFYGCHEADGEWGFWPIQEEE